MFVRCMFNTLYGRRNSLSFGPEDTDREQPWTRRCDGVKRAMGIKEINATMSREQTHSGRVLKTLQPCEGVELKRENIDSYEVIILFLLSCILFCGSTELQAFYCT